MNIKEQNFKKFNIVAMDNFILENLKKEYTENNNFKFVVIDNFLKNQFVKKIAQEHKEISEEYWIKYNHFNEKKMGLEKISLMGKTTKILVQELSSKLFLQWLSELSGFNNLISDPDLDGGGLHKINKGGYLNIHTDYQSHTKKKNWKRKINLLLYLTPEYKDNWGGNLEFRDYRDKSLIKSITPKFNRCVIFSTDKKSFHGHPLPLECPENSARRSLALYYFQKEEKDLPLKPTLYTSIPSDNIIKKILIKLDVYAVYFYSLMKRYSNLDNHKFNKFISRFFK